MSGQGIGSEDVVAAAWIVSVLRADSQLVGWLPGGISDGPAPQAAKYPLVEMLMQSSLSVSGVGTVEVQQDQLWIIRGVTEGLDFAPLVPIANRLHGLLHGVTGAIVSGGTIGACVRVQLLRQVSVQGGRQFRYLGGIYRIQVQGN